MNYSPWDCLVQQLYPGDNLVDWIMFNAYGGGNQTWDAAVNHFYSLLTNNSNSSHNYLSKPWGIVEWAYHNGTSAQYANYFNQVKTALDTNAFPKLKAYMVYDSRDQGSNAGLNSRVAYDDSGNYQNTQAAAYSAFANDARIAVNGIASTPPPPTPTPTADTTAPSVTLTTPADGTTVSGAFTVSGTASDNIGVTAVTLRIDNTYVATKNNAPYNFTVNSSTLSQGTHSILLRAWDAANNMGASRAVTIVVSSANGGNNGGTTSGNSGGTVIQAGGTTSGNTIAASGTLKIVPSIPGASLHVRVDGKPLGGTSIDTTKLTNGTHTVTITQNGQTTSQIIAIDNPWWAATRNKIRAHPVAYGLGGAVSVVLLILVGLLGRTYYAGQLLQSIRMRRYLRTHRASNQQTMHR
jgi:hypothetical protein